ncbi:MAG: inositol monophosphatase [Hydrogenibacillus sp.]|nr:inositol monophosphatase [Hydrogenibacillus sp.]
MTAHTLDGHEIGEWLRFARLLAGDAGALIKERLKAAENGTRIDIGTKSGPSDLVTDVDRAVEALLVSRIRHQYPAHGVLGEEGAREAGRPEARGLVWVLDPIDGTTNFIHQRVNFCVSIALYAGDQGLVGVVYDPMREELFWAARGVGAYLNDRRLRLDAPKTLRESLIGTSLTWIKRARKAGVVDRIWTIGERSRGIRSLGAAALETAYVAAGRLDAYLSLQLSPWDFAAGKLIIEEAGGAVVDFLGTPLSLEVPRLGFLAAHRDVAPELIDILAPWAKAQPDA